MTDGWINHDGGPCPVAPGRLAMVNGDVTVALPVSAINWAAVKKYRTFARVNPPDSGPSPFVRDTAARIMAGIVTSDAFLAVLDEGDTQATIEASAAFAVRAAKALEAALKEAGE